MPFLASVARGVQLAQIIFLRHWCEEHNAWADTAAQPRAATESLVTIPHSIQPFWLEFQAIVGGDVQARFYEAFHFDDNEPAANELSRLVLVGTKRATAGLAWSFEAANRPPPGRLNLVEPLTDRERDVLRFLPSRLSVREIADELYVSVNTLKFHLKVIYRKLDCGSRAEAAEMARAMTSLRRAGQQSSTRRR